MRVRKFNEEIALRGNAGLPDGEMDRIAKEMQDKTGVVPDKNTGEYSSQLQELYNQSAEICKGHEESLQKLATDLIKFEFGDILDKTNIRLDAKLTDNMDDVKDFLDDNSETEEPSEEDIEQIEMFSDIDDLDIDSEVDKRKIINNITQGEAKNTKRIVALSEVRDDLTKILGSADEALKLQNLWLSMCDLADKCDWDLSIMNITKAMSNGGVAGASALEFVDNDDDDDDMPLSFDEFDSDDRAERIPVVKVISIDFTILLHELLKGIYEYISYMGLPEDNVIRDEVIKLTDTYKDEAEDFRYGPFLAAKLRDFINKCDNVDKVENMRRYVYGQMIQLEADDFLDLFKRILTDDLSAYNEVNNIIEYIISEFDKEAESEREYEQQMREYEQQMREYEEQQRKPKSDTPKVQETEPVGDVVDDLANLSNTQLRELIDDAIDSGDFDKIPKIQSYIKESNMVDRIKIRKY